MTNTETIAHARTCARFSVATYDADGPAAVISAAHANGIAYVVVEDDRATLLTPAADDGDHAARQFGTAYAAVCELSECSL